MNAEKLSITLPSDMAQMVRDQVASGSYASNSEVIREALRLWSDREQERARRLEMVRAKIDAAADNPVRLTPGEVRARFDRLHEETLRGPEQLPPRALERTRD